MSRYETVRDFLYREARYLDDKDWDAWLELYASDASFWMPAWDDRDELTQDPQREISLIWYGNRGGLEDRVFRIKTERSSATMPDTRTSHNISNIEVLGGYATGIEVQSSGDASVTNSGDIVAGNGLQMAYYYYAGTQTAYYIYSGTQLANGIDVGSNGEGAAVSVSNSGDITADGIFGANGIVATASGYGGTVTVTNSGEIYASQNQKYGYGATGITASGDSDTSVGNSGMIDVYSGGVASGISRGRYSV